MTSRIPFALVGLALLIALAAVPAGPVPSTSVRAAATLGVTFNYSPGTVAVNTQTQIQFSISGGSSPFTVWVNGSVPGCNPPSNPFTTVNATNSFPCYPSQTGNFNTHLDVADGAGNHGSASATLSVQSGGGNTGGNNTGGNNTGGFNLGPLQDMFAVLMIMAIVFLVCAVAVAASAVALAVLVPRRLKQIRKALQGEPLKKTKSKPEATKAETAPADPAPKPPEDEL